MGINSFRVVNSIATAETKTFASIMVPATTGSLTPLSGTDLFATQVDIFGYKSAGTGAPVNNTAPIYIGTLTLASETIAPGGKMSVSPPVGGRLNLAQMAVGGTTGDFALVRFMQ